MRGRSCRRTAIRCAQHRNQNPPPPPPSQQTPQPAPVGVELGRAGQRPRRSNSLGGVNWRTFAPAPTIPHGPGGMTAPE